MQRALDLAQNSYSTPNPGVGCVLVRDNIVVGEGWTQPVGQAHAEVMALRAAGEQARGTTAYVTLEPCCHWGRTPPCTEALIAARVARVVVAIADKDPRVGGKGIAQLRAAAIEVKVGVAEQKARASNEDFFHFQETGTPFVTLKAAMSLDGKIATRTGSSQWITGEAARQHVHLLRAKSGAVMVGIGTLLADDAQLTARLADGKAPRQPLRIIVDSHLRTPPDCRAIRLIRPALEAFVPEAFEIANRKARETGADEEAPLLIATTQGADEKRAEILAAMGAEIVHLPSDGGGHVELAALLNFIAQRGIISILVEGGGTLNAALLQNNLVDKALFFIAPKFVGGRDAPTPLEGVGIAQMAEAVTLSGVRTRRFGPDISIEGYIKKRN